MKCAARMADEILRELYSAEEVRERIDELVDRLYQFYADSPSVFIVIAEGAKRFAEILVERHALRNVNPELVTLRAHRTEGTSLGSVQVEAMDPTVFEERDVLIIDDIADEGRTLEAVGTLVEEGEPRSVRTAVLVDKSERRKVDLNLNYVGFGVKSGWVVGLGMDLDGRYRDLDYIAIIEGT